GQTSTTHGTQYHKRELMLPQEILNMPEQECLIFKMDNYPIQAKKIYWFKDELFKDRGNMPVPKVPSLVS
ncbi:MAG: type IV secretory system conjugative DNA transfer family protein, partial [Alteromonadaceae bacterium]|nr:type IV secretory system conjugative DNA transfer family protein [Alteromonadaceae bacterium]